MLKTVSRVSCVLSTGNPSIGQILPLSRIAGGKPAVRWTSEARTSTIRRSTSEKSKDIATYIGRGAGFLKLRTASSGDAEDLLEAGQSRPDLADPVLAQGQHS